MLLNLAAAVDAVRAVGCPVQRVLLIGGASASTAVQEIAPDLFGVPVAVPSPGEYVAVGAARQAAWALAGGEHPPRWDVDVDVTVDPGDTTRVPRSGSGTPRRSPPRTPRSALNATYRVSESSDRASRSSSWVRVSLPPWVLPVPVMPNAQHVARSASPEGEAPTSHACFATGHPPVEARTASAVVVDP